MKWNENGNVGIVSTFGRINGIHFFYFACDLWWDFVQMLRKDVERWRFGVSDEMPNKIYFGQ